MSNKEKARAAAVLIGFGYLVNDGKISRAKSSNINSLFNVYVDADRSGIFISGEISFTELQAIYTYLADDEDEIAGDKNRLEYLKAHSEVVRLNDKEMAELKQLEVKLKGSE